MTASILACKRIQSLAAGEFAMIWLAGLGVIFLATIAVICISIHDKLSAIAPSLSNISSIRFTAEIQRDEMLKIAKILEAIEEHARATAEPHYEARRREEDPFSVFGK